MKQKSTSSNDSRPPTVGAQIVNGISTLARFTFAKENKVLLATYQLLNNSSRKKNALSSNEIIQVEPKIS